MMFEYSEKNRIRGHGTLEFDTEKSRNRSNKKAQLWLQIVLRIAVQLAITARKRILLLLLHQIVEKKRCTQIQCSSSVDCRANFWDIIVVSWIKNMLGKDTRISTRVSSDNLFIKAFQDGRNFRISSKF